MHDDILTNLQRPSVCKKERIDDVVGIEDGDFSEVMHFGLMALISCRKYVFVESLMMEPK